VVVGVAGCVDGPECSALDREDLLVDDRLLGFAGCMLVNRRREGWVQTQQVGNATGVVAMPVSKEYVGEADVRGREGRRNQVGPLRDALAGVDEEALGAGTYNVGIGTLKCELDELCQRPRRRLLNVSVYYLPFQHSVLVRAVPAD